MHHARADEHSEESTSPSRRGRSTGEHGAACDFVDCFSHGIVAEKPCKCIPRPTYHLDCFRREAVQHWNTCSGCRCRPEKIYPCPNCNHLITLVAGPLLTDPRTMIREFAYGSSSGSHVALGLLFGVVALCSWMLLVMALVPDRIPPTIMAIFSLTPALASMFDASHLSFSTVTPATRLYVLLALGGTFAFAVAEFVILIVQPHTIWKDLKYVWLTLNIAINCVVAHKMFWNLSIINAMLSPRVA